MARNQIPGEHDRRYLCLWLPYLSTDRLGEADGPLVTVESIGNRISVSAVNQAAQTAGLDDTLTLAAARAIRPNVATIEADPEADGAMLAALGRWAVRFTPLVSPNPGKKYLMLDVTGCAHLHGGEAKLMASAVAGLEELGFSTQAAIAGTPGAAAILPRYSRQEKTYLVEPDISLAEILRGIPVVALQFAMRPPEESILETLGQVGLRRIGDLYRIPRAALTARFGRRLSDALDETLGETPNREENPALIGKTQPIDPMVHRAPWRIRLAFPDPIGMTEDVEAALIRLLDRLCLRLETENQGCRRLQLTAYRTDGDAQVLEIGTARPERDPTRLARLFDEKLKGLDPGYGIDAFLLEARIVEPFENTQSEVMSFSGTGIPGLGGDGLADLVDRLTNRLGDGAVLRLAPVESHRPDAAETAVPALPPRSMAINADSAKVPWPRTAPRPTRLLARPCPIQLLSAPRDGEPPLAFRLNGHRCHVRIATGPERISPDWWQRDARWHAGARDYFRVELEDGRRLWIYRDGPHLGSGGGDWFLHGVFA